MSLYESTEINTIVSTSQELVRLGCSVVYNPTYSYDLCNGVYCRLNVDCESGCCYYNYCSSSCGPELYWLWWTLSFTFFFCCIIFLIAGARRRRMAALRRAQMRNNSCDSDDHTRVIIVQQHNPNQPAVGQPVYQNYQTGAQVTGQQAYYPQQQQQQMYYQQPVNPSAIDDMPPAKQ